jgi:hypothetical protein
MKNQLDQALSTIYSQGQYEAAIQPFSDLPPSILKTQKFGFGSVLPVVKLATLIRLELNFEKRSN